MDSASRYDCAQHIEILSVIVAEGELREIQRQIVLAHVVIGADDSAFKQGPKRFNVVGMDVPANVLAFSVADCFVLIAESVQRSIATMLIGRDQIYLVAHGLADEAIKRARIGIIDDLAENITFPANSADDSCFARTETAGYVRFLIQWRFLSFPPMKVSSTSTMLIS
jgi:hypothetical protein